MGDDVRANDGNSEGGVVIQLRPTGSTPPPLPRLPRAIPTPGGGSTRTAFQAVLARRYDAAA